MTPSDEAGWFRTIIVGLVALAVGGATGMLFERASHPVEPRELPLAIMRAGQPFPVGFEDHATSGIVADSDIALMLRGDAVVVRPLTRVPEPCGGWEDSTDPSPPCRSMLTFAEGAGHERLHNLIFWGDDPPKGSGMSAAIIINEPINLE